MNDQVVSKLFQDLYNAKNEHDVDEVIAKYPNIFNQENWFPLGENESNFGVIENQQSNPVAALVEKLTNSIDAILMRRCLELELDPKSSKAPRSIEEAISKFFPDHKNWDLSDPRRKQAENIQILADSYPRDTDNTSLIIYDDGEGQRPEDFESTFLSLLRGNKNEIHFVQGKYNMGGSGAIVFCGKKRYQLIASKRYDGKGLFGFTIIRKHPLDAKEAQTKKSTWYEYLKIDGCIPAFPINEVKLELLNRKFKTGTIIKLYSYDLKGNKHIRRDLRRSINEFLYEPALPIYVIESPERYPNDKVLQDVLYGLKRRLIKDNLYIEETISEVYKDKQIGEMKVTVHVFKARAKGKTVKDTISTIQNEFFKNNMAVLFSVNGQVHGHYTSEFITRSLKFNLLRDYLLIHVDCTNMNYDFRSELFMASRDRLKQGEESTILRRVLADNLKKGDLQEIYKRRKDKISVDTTADDDLLKSFAENLPISDDLRRLLSQTFKLDQKDIPKKPKQPSSSSSKSSSKTETISFNPNRFPSFFKVDLNQKGDKKVVTVPLNGERVVRFNTDVENEYFDRVEDPGDMKMAVMGYTPNDVTGGDEKGTVNDISDLFTVNRKSPNEGTIKVIFKPTDEIKVGDEVQVRVDLTSVVEDFTEIFWVKITDPPLTQKVTVPQPEEEEKIGLPKHVLVYQNDPDSQGLKTWEELSTSGIDMDWDTVIYPSLEGDVLETIYINMDSNVLKNYKSKIRNLTLEQNQLADQRYISAVYFHTLFLYVINKNRQYRISKMEKDSEQEIDLTDYIKDVFSSHYAAFLMNFGVSGLMEGFG